MDLICLSRTFGCPFSLVIHPLTLVFDLYYPFTLFCSLPETCRTVTVTWHLTLPFVYVSFPVPDLLSSNWGPQNLTTIRLEHVQGLKRTTETQDLRRRTPFGEEVYVGRQLCRTDFPRKRRQEWPREDERIRNESYQKDVIEGLEMPEPFLHSPILPSEDEGRPVSTRNGTVD